LLEYPDWVGVRSDAGGFCHRPCLSGTDGSRSVDHPGHASSGNLGVLPLASREISITRTRRSAWVMAGFRDLSILSHFMPSESDLALPPWRQQHNILPIQDLGVPPWDA